MTKIPPALKLTLETCLFVCLFPDDVCLLFGVSMCLFDAFVYMELPLHLFFSGLPFFLVFYIGLDGICLHFFFRICMRGL